MEKEYEIYAYERNQIKLYTVFGDNNSRSFVFNIIEKSGIIMPSANAPETNQMLDLTGYDVSLKIIGTSVEASGTIISAQNGKVSFTIDSGFTAETGEYQCAVVLTKNDEVLSIIGITLIVDYPEDEKTDYKLTLHAGELTKLHITVYNEDGTIHVLTHEPGRYEAIYFIAKENLDDELPTIFSGAFYTDAEGDGYNLYINPDPDISGKFIYTIYLDKNDGREKTRLMPDADLYIVKQLI